MSCLNYLVTKFIEYIMERIFRVATYERIGWSDPFKYIKLTESSAVPGWCTLWCFNKYNQPLGSILQYNGRSTTELVDCKISLLMSLRIMDIKCILNGNSGFA